jgi:hypothetical protein
MNLLDLLFPPFFVRWQEALTLAAIRNTLNETSSLSTEDKMALLSVSALEGALDALSAVLTFEVGC